MGTQIVPYRWTRQVIFIIYNLGTQSCTVLLVRVLETTSILHGAFVPSWKVHVYTLELVVDYIRLLLPASLFILFPAPFPLLPSTHMCTFLNTQTYSPKMPFNRLISSC